MGAVGPRSKTEAELEELGRLLTDPVARAARPEEIRAAVDRARALLKVQLAGTDLVAELLAERRAAAESDSA
ncbi:MAG: hypothetical protein IPL43_08445 [Micropruina sp.]|nr:hypothetical protein [Micropruina sp.]